METDRKGEAKDKMSSMKDAISSAKESLSNAKKKLDEDNPPTPDDEAKSLFDSLSESFRTPEAWERGNQFTTQDPNTPAPQTLKVERFEKKSPETRGFLGVAGMQDLKKELSESFINPLKFKFFIQKLKQQTPIGNTPDEKTKVMLQMYEKYEKFGVSIPTGLLFYGPPWTGKTFLTKKLAEELEAGIIIKSVGEFGSSYMHQTSKNIKEFFAQAKETSKDGPIILFLDEIDSLVSKRTNQVDANKAEEVSQFLQEINNLKEAQNLILIGATNRPDHLDSAILRTGRFDKKIYLWPPDFEARKELFQIHIEKTWRPHDPLDYDELAKLTDGYVSADIEGICNEAARDASRSILDVMTQMQKDFASQSLEEIQSNLHSSVINMEILKQAILDTTSSLKMVDMSIYDSWLESIE